MNDDYHSFKKFSKNYSTKFGHFVYRGRFACSFFIFVLMRKSHLSTCFNHVSHSLSANIATDNLEMNLIESLLI